MTESVVTETRTEVTTEEVTETRYRCHVCEMLYEDTDVITVGIDRYDGDSTFASGPAPRAERTICKHCADGLFGYELDDDSTLSESKTPYGTDWVTVSAAIGTLLMLLAIPTAVVTGAVAVAGGAVSVVPLVVGALAVGVLLGVVAS